MYIGIDFGVRSATMAGVFDGGPEVIPNKYGQESTPHVIHVEERDEEEQILVGEPAANRQPLAPERTRRLKRPHLAMDETYEIAGTEYRPRDVVRHILDDLVASANESSDREIQGAIIAVPYWFDVATRESMKESAERAGLDEVALLDEPTAACLGYGIHTEEGDDVSLLVYDLRKESFEASIVKAGENQLEVLGTDGNSLGGEAFTERLYADVKPEVLREMSRPAPTNVDEAKLRDQVKEAKERVSVSDRAEINFLSSHNERVEIEVARDRFDNLVDDIVSETIEVVDGVLESTADYRGVSRIDEVLLVGGATRMPIVQQRLEERFDTEPKMDADPSTVIARGAATYANQYLNTTDFAR